MGTTTVLMLIGTALMFIALGLSIREWFMIDNKGKVPSNLHYRVYMISIMALIPIEIVTLQWFNTIIWSFVLVMAIKRLKRMGLDIWK